MFSHVKCLKSHVRGHVIDSFVLLFFWGGGNNRAHYLLHLTKVIPVLTDVLIIPCSFIKVCYLSPHSLIHLKKKVGSKASEIYECLIK